MSEQEADSHVTEPGATIPAEEAEQPRRPSRRWTLVLVLALALAVVTVYGIVQGPEKLGLKGDSTGQSVALDTDRDGLTDTVETRGWVTQDGSEYRTDPKVADTDGDGLTDSDEAGPPVAGDAGGEPSGNDAETTPERESEASSETVFTGYSNPLVADTDDDGLDDANEADLGLDPFTADDDEDGIDDGYEVEILGTAPDTADTDGDGFDDGYEDANRESQGLDPLAVDVKVSKMSYATDFAIGSVMGDAWRRDSFAWLAGNLASGGSSGIPVIGWIVGPLADARDAVASAIRGDWVGSGFSAVGVVPYAGDAVAVPGKAARFVARNPELAAAAAAAVIAINKIPEAIKIDAAKQIWKGWDDLKVAGAGEQALLQLSKGRTNLDDLASGIKRPGHVAGPVAKFSATGPEGEEILEDLYGATTRGADKQVWASTSDCLASCNTRGRFFDVFVDGVAHESKVGYVRLTPAIERQIRSDAHLVSQGTIEGAHWHFFASSRSNTLGADSRVLDLLDELGIPYTTHLPANP